MLLGTDELFSIVIIIGFTNNEYIVNESGGTVTLTVLVRGGDNQCNQTGWMLYLNLTAVSAQCKNYKGLTLNRKYTRMLLMI